MTPRNLSNPFIRAAFCIALLVLPVATAWNLAVENTHPRLVWKLRPPLSGVTRDVPLVWSWRALSDGSLQKALASRVTEALPIRPPLVRLNNELRFEMFGEQTIAGVVRGAHGQLFEQSYITDYCSRTEGMAAMRAQNVVSKLKDIQDYYRARNAVFIYLITPSKAAHMPDDFVTRVPCASTPAARTRFVPEYVKLLQEAGIEVVDSASFIHSLKGQYEVGLFPQGGAHWNNLGGARGTALLVDEINRQAGRMLVPPYTFTYTVSGATSGVDTELADLINVLFPPLGYLTPKVTFQPSVSCTDDPSHMLNAAFVGSSFTNLPAEILIRDNCLRAMSMYFYLKLDRFGGVPFRRLQTELKDNDLAPLRDAKIMILEENESFAGNADYIGALRDFLARPSYR